MIIKNLSRSNAGGSKQLVKYVFRYIFRDNGLPISARDSLRPFYLPPGVVLSAQDLHFLHCERVDAGLLADLMTKYPNGDIQAYVRNYLMPQAWSREPERQTASGNERQQPFILKHNMRANSLNGFIREFEKNEQGRIRPQKNQVTIHHTILSMGVCDREKITEPMLRDLFRQYVQLRGERNVYAGTVHLEDHIHLHIAMGGATVDGRSARISKAKFEDVKMKLQEYQLAHYPELSHSAPVHGKAKVEQQKEEVKKIYRTERTKEKESILRCIETNFFTARSTAHFISLLNEHGYKEYYRNGKLAGIQTEHYKYRFTSLGVHFDTLRVADEALRKENETLKEIRQVRSKENKELRLSVLKEEKSNGQEMGLSDTEIQALKELRDLRESRGNERDVCLNREEPEADSESSQSELRDSHAGDQSAEGEGSDEESQFPSDDDLSNDETRPF